MSGMMKRSDLQELLLRKSIVSERDIDAAIRATQGSSFTWLEQLLLLQVIDEHHLCETLSRAAAVPMVDLRELAAVPHRILDLIPPDLALEHRVIPISLERDGDLRVAMLDPTDGPAFAEVQFFAGVRVLREVATATGIACALFHYYDGQTALWPRFAHKPLASVVVTEQSLSY
jgi:Type II secretion system (T2SS), protein E, N-terminal domain